MTVVVLAAIIRNSLVYAMKNLLGTVTAHLRSDYIAKKSIFALHLRSLSVLKYHTQKSKILNILEKFMAKVRARHILVKTEERCNELKTEIEEGAGFSTLAQQHSFCPSGKYGGDLDEFGPGQMVPEFDAVVFSAPVGEVQGPVKTEFGYHLLEVLERTD